MEEAAVAVVATVADAALISAGVYTSGLILQRTASGSIGMTDNARASLDKLKIWAAFAGSMAIINSPFGNLLKQNQADAPQADIQASAATAAPASPSPNNDNDKNKSENNSGSNSSTNKSSDYKRVSDGQMKDLQKNGFDPHGGAKPEQGGRGGKIDVYKDKNGDLYYRTAKGDHYEPMNENLNDYYGK